MTDNQFTRTVGITHPIICGAMYPCSNPELVAAVSREGGIGIVQPVSLTWVHGHEFREGLRLIRSLSEGRPFGMNALIESSSRAYHRRMERWVDIAIEEGVRFFVTSLGKPRWVVDRVAAAGGVVYHDVTDRRWAEKAIDSGIHGLIAVNNRAGGHAGPFSAAQLFDDLAPLGLPLIAAGGIATQGDYRAALDLGYQGVQLGTRFIATVECRAAEAYKAAIVRATEADIVLSERITGVPLAVIRTPHVARLGLKAGPIARRLLRGRRTKHFMRSLYALRSALQFRRSSLDETGSAVYWQAGKSVQGIDSIRTVAEVMAELTGHSSP